MNILKGTRLLFLRAATTEFNVKCKEMGLIDHGLGYTGNIQLQKYVEKIDFATGSIFASPMIRAKVTAKAVQSVQNPNPSITTIGELQNRDFGYLEGKSLEEIFALERQEEAGLKVYDCHFESREAFRDRVLVGVNRCFEYSDAPFIVSHSLVYGALCDILGLDFIRRIDNLALSEISRVGDRWHAKYIRV